MTLIATGGVIIGGWEYVWTAFGATWVVLAGYALSLYWRGKENT